MVVQNVMGSDSLSIPGTSLGLIVERASQGILGKLSPEKPTLFGPVRGALFTDTPRASVVGESEAKTSAPVTFDSWSADPIKLVTQVRVSDEFLWADTDYRMGVINDAVAPAIGNSIGRGVDLLAFHGVNPATGQITPRMPKFLAQTPNVVELDNANPDASLTNVVSAILAGGGNPTGMALDASFGFTLATMTNPVTGLPMNPGMGWGQDIGSYKGINTATSSTVKGVPELAQELQRPTPVAIVGDFSQVKWGFQRNMPLEVLRWGNPDNMYSTDGTPRDLAGHNEVLLRVEAVVYIAIGNLNRFGVIRPRAITL